MQNLWEQVRQRVTRNQLTRFGFSLLLAILLWGWVTQLQDPIETRPFTELAIEDPNLTGTLEVVTSLPRVDVSITDAESQLERLNRADVIVSLNVTEIDGTGTYQVPIVVNTAVDVREIEVSPDTISIQVEEEVSENFPLVPENQVLDGDARRVGKVTPEVSQVTVRGTESAVERVQRVILPVSIDGQSTDFTMMIEPYAVDINNQRIQEVTILPEQVRTFVEIQTSGKSVSVVPQTSGAPADGFVVQQQISLPPTVIVDGPADALESMLFINTEPVDITGATESLSQTVGLESLPDGVTVIEPINGEVEVRVSIGSSSNTPNVIQGVTVEVQNANADYDVNVDPETVDLSVRASPDVLSALTPEDIRVSVDVAGLGPGVYTLTPEVSLPPNVATSGLDPESVTVLVSEEGTPVTSGTPVGIISFAPPNESTTQEPD